MATGILEEYLAARTFRRLSEPLIVVDRIRHKDPAPLTEHGVVALSCRIDVAHTHDIIDADPLLTEP